MNDETVQCNIGIDTLFDDSQCRCMTAFDVEFTPGNTCRRYYNDIAVQHNMVTYNELDSVIKPMNTGYDGDAASNIT